MSIDPVSHPSRISLCLGSWAFQSLFSWNSPSDDEVELVKLHVDGFNPCFRGTRPRTALAANIGTITRVSILVFVELALGQPRIDKIYQHGPVSILVFVELALGRLMSVIEIWF